MKKEDTGIYKITNIVNGKVYIGQSINLRKRLNDHKALLKRGAHDNSHLQSSVDKYGIENFLFEIIEIVSVEILTIRENFWMEEYKSYIRENGYNINKPSENIANQSLSEETKKKIGKANSHYTDQELLDELVRFYKENGKMPTNRTLLKRNGFPSSVTYFNRFGSLKKALELSGLYDKVENKKMFERKEYTKEEVVECFRTFIKNNGRFPNHLEIKDTKNNNLVTGSVILKHFKSIDELKIELGFGNEHIKNIKKIEALEMIRVLYEKEGFVTARSIEKSKITRSGKWYRDNFGSMSNACKLAGVPYAIHNKTIDKIN